MPKATGKFYAVRSGRYGPVIYDSFAKFKAATLGYSGNSAKSFLTYRDAELWLNEGLSAALLDGHKSGEEDHFLETMPGRGLSKRSHSRSYPVSAHQWTEYESPSKRCFCIDSSGDKSLSTQSCKQNQDSLTRSSVQAPDVKCASNSSDSPKPFAEKIQLSPEQQYVLNLVRSGQNVFFTGPAGTGKSVLLREIINTLGGPSASVAITASTGIAGLNIGGSTIHSWSGIRLGKESAKDLANRIYFSKKYKERWQGIKTLIIDEVSMLDGTVFDKLEYIGRNVRKKAKPFGGIQLIVSGDFFQLPPVPDHVNGVPVPPTFAFDAKSWYRCLGRPVVLSQVFRQKDNEFVDMLSEMRKGELTPKSIANFFKLSRPLVFEDGIEPSMLYPLRAQVEGCNNDRLKALETPSFTYHSMDSRGYDTKGTVIEEDTAKRSLDRLVAINEISLKVGAQVMLIKNMVQGKLVNGSIGKVTEFLTTHEASKRNLKIAMPNGEKGEQDQPRNMSPKELERYRKKIEEEQKARSKVLLRLNDHIFASNVKWPLVKFTDGMELLCAPVDFTVEGLCGNIEALRMQVPLILAWALSIHKSQGQTLSRVRVDLGCVFEKGQAYVALSRATTMESLEVVHFHPSKVLAHPRVVAWQATWSDTAGSKPCDSQGYDIGDEMDGEEAIQRSRSLYNRDLAS